MKYDKINAYLTQINERKENSNDVSDGILEELSNIKQISTSIKALLEYIKKTDVISDVIWSSGEIVSTQRMEIPKRITSGTAIGFPWHEASKGRLTIRGWGTRRVEYIENLNGASVPYSTTDVTGDRISSYQTKNGLIICTRSDDGTGLLWFQKEPFGEIKKVLTMKQGYAQPFSYTHNQNTNDVWVSEYGGAKESDNPRRLYHSSDGGENWTEHVVDDVGVFHHIHTPIYHPPTGNLYVSTGDDGGKHVYKSTDGGKTFTQIPSAVGKKLVSAVVRDDGKIVWGSDDSNETSGIYLHDTDNDVFTFIKMHTDTYRGYNGSLTWSNPNNTENSILMIPTRERPYNPPGIFATKDYVNFHRIFDTSQEGEYDSQGIESIVGPDADGHFYANVFGTGPINSIVFKAPNVYYADEVDASLSEATANVVLEERMSIVDCIVPHWHEVPSVSTELINIEHTNGYISVILESDGKVSITDGINTSSTGVEGDTMDLMIKWDGEYDAGVQFPFILEISSNESKVKVLNRITHEWAIATIDTDIPEGMATLTVKGDANHQVKTINRVREDSWSTLKRLGMAMY